jgi:hypothetical protein
MIELILAKVCDDGLDFSGPIAPRSTVVASSDQ